MKHRTNAHAYVSDKEIRLGLTTFVGESPEQEIVGSSDFHLGLLDTLRLIAQLERAVDHLTTGEKTSVLDAMEVARNRYLLLTK